ncbi:4-(cytidine 5'-diphospho)-2-C-methyl-D-erythritol kinase [Georgenia sp. TF02-10]|uniref:4-(cytidine 5'-diphospho)-2-C-methyl-D-erythritol kinase n=1 Tax=Georgenia sp. TF02-10 TaxID=2917725 RepID=UPI001FA7EBA3|nr:4-(cytidine 5'-diphospho)-2-C-methyl-D-erythritol kinase [Georgenia sp. TF02-10]UNX55547.1 4-(cytidine 5'-diphospho)-2-C-methyl-D-erythritol kinase [Georgenia sp. TF02-10]
MTATEVQVRAPGKINLALRVGPPGPDGYHPLVTVFQAVSLGEDVVARPADGISLEIRGRGTDLPTDGTNLAVRAAELLARTVGVDAGVHLTLTKRVPVAGGMAGGSADAAATLLACDQLWGAGLAREELAELAADLGADVPFALTGATALGTGRGDVLSPVLVRGTYHWVLAVQAEGLSTPEVFRAFDEQHGYSAGGRAADRGDGGRSVAPAVTPAPAPAPAPAVDDAPAPAVDDALLTTLLSGDPLAVARHLVNDLQDAAVDLRPELGDVLAACERAGALGAVVSGSGPTVAALALDGPHAESVAGVVRAADVAAEVLTVTGPAPGARVLEHVRGQP